ncbi:SAM35 (YHR083W) [Zygosaccharomyces parabailii]|nr:SAM35 (YHR083W) [Zygosaccharomyces parabailii]CDH10188.1 related to Sorting assembly machinery 35 kDa subunit [Zygosaccharomyces bailii ISA1307]
MTFFTIPGPVKALFDYFPLETYSAVSKQDDAMTHELSQRTYDFQGSNSFQEDINNTFTLGIYNVFHESKADVLLASDPWCLYAQLSLCKKNSLKLPQKTRLESGKSKKPRQTMAVLSPLATTNETLPILIEGYHKRFIRSSESIHETLKLRVVENPQQLMYIILLDHIIYDCWVAQVLFHISDEEFLNLYSFDTGEQKLGVKKLVMMNLKAQLIKRNEFSLRHKILAKIITAFAPYRASSLAELLDPIFENCKRVLTQFQKLLNDKPISTAPTYLELKIASYVLCALNLPVEAPLRVFVEQKCPHLLNHSHTVLDKFK